MLNVQIFKSKLHATEAFRSVADQLHIMPKTRLNAYDAAFKAVDPAIKKIVSICGL